MSEFSVRAAERRDLDGLSRVYNHYVATSTATFDLTPPSPEQYRTWFAEHAGGRHQAWVATGVGDAVAGFAYSGPFRPRRAYDTTVEVSVYLAPESVGRGLGGRLYRALFDSLCDEELHRALAVIALPNPASVALHTRWGFREVGRLHEVGWKFGQFWDVAFFERPLARGVRVEPEAKR